MSMPTMRFSLAVPFQAPVSLSCLIEKWHKATRACFSCCNESKYLILLESLQENIHFNYVITVKLCVFMA